MLKGIDDSSQPKAKDKRWNIIPLWFHTTKYDLTLYVTSLDEC